MPNSTTTTGAPHYTPLRLGGAAVFSLLAALGTVPAGATTITEFPVPTVNSSPAGIVSGPDGNLWFTESIGNKIGRITAAGAISEFPLPHAASGPRGITSGPDANLWFTEYDGHRIGRITTTGVITEFTVPTALSYPWGITSGPDGNLWFTEMFGNKIGRITTTGTITEFPLPLLGSYPMGIVSGPDGNLWFAEGQSRIGRITTAGTLTEFATPTFNSYPTGIASGPDGKLWFTEPDIDSIGRITTAGVITEFVLPSGSSTPRDIASGPDGRLWFTEVGGNRIGRIDTGGGIVEFATPTATSEPDGIVTGPDGNLWFTESNVAGNRIGRLTTAPAKGDLNGDGHSDLLFRSLVNGAHNGIWFMNGAVRESQVEFVPDAASADWLIRGADDFDSARSPGAGRDFMTDLVFWNRVTGNVEFWLLDHGTLVGTPVPLSGGSALSPNWDLSATAEFNHDGKPDLVWRDLVSQSIVIWTMNGTAKIGEIVPSPAFAVDDNWAIVAAADYNNDGQTDFLWYNATSGKIVTWYMDANVVRTTGQFTTPSAAGDANWKVVASADYSGSSGPGTPPLGSPDIVWRNETSGKQVVWHLDFASTRVFGEFTSPAAPPGPLNWTVAGPR